MPRAGDFPASDLPSAARAMKGYRVGERVRLLADAPDLGLRRGARGVVCRRSYMAVVDGGAQNRVGVEFGCPPRPVAVAERQIAGGWDAQP